jgi:hypothetical protein
VKLFQDHEGKVEDNPTHFKFLLSFNNDEGRSNLVQHVVWTTFPMMGTTQVVWKFQRIVSHKEPIKPNHPEYKQSPYILMIENKTGEITSEPLQMIAADDHVTCTFRVPCPK